MAHVLLVRHGQNDWVSKNRLAGWTPGVRLNDEGRQQAANVAERLAKLPVKAVYSSPLTRCLETAAYIAGRHNLDVQTIEEVGEVRYGAWEGQKIKKLAKKKEWYTVQHFPSRFRFPGGEWLYEVQARGVAAIEELNGRHEPDDLIVICSHADLIKLVLAHYLGMHIDLFQRIGLSPASVSALSLLPGGRVRVDRVNDDGPLRPPPKPKERDKKKRQKGMANAADEEE